MEELKSIAQLAQELGVTRQAVYQKIRYNKELSTEICKFTVKEGNRTLYTLQAQERIKQAFESSPSVNSKVNVDSKLIDSLQAQIDYLKAEHEQDRRERQAIYVKALQLEEERTALKMELKAIEIKNDMEQAQEKEKLEKAQSEKEQAEQAAAALTQRVKELEAALTTEKETAEQAQEKLTELKEQLEQVQRELTASTQEPQKKSSWLDRLLRRNKK